MSAQPHTGTSPADEVPSRQMVEDLGCVYRLALVTDQTGRVQWVSEPWSAWCGREADYTGMDVRAAIPKMHRPEASFSILSELRERGFALRSPVEVLNRDGLPDALELSIFRVASSAGTPAFNVVIARPSGEEEPRPEPHSLLDSSADAILAVDRDGFISYANPAVEELLGIPPVELLGSPVAALASRVGALQQLLQALAAESAVELEITLRRHDGEDLPVAGTLAPHRRTDGSVEGAVLSLRSIAARRDAEVELSQRNAELENCVNTLAHDLRSPLVAMMGFSRLLRQDYGSQLDDTGAHFVDRIEQAGRTMEGLIHDLLELSRIGQPGERPAMVDPRAVMLQLAAECKPRLDVAGIQLTLPEHPPLVYCDRTRLYQVFSNLIGNAIDHMGECDDRRIVVEVREEPEAHRVTVQDFGCGIAAEHHERIFEVFQRIGPRHARGTGMGLAIVRKIADTHDGRAWVESQPGQGASFHVTFPRP
jgi:PAS domain S-box-containing protein